MKAPLKVLWSEGQLIQVHNFQRQDAYHEGRLAQLAQASHPYLWGVRNVQWNLDALANNLLLAESMSLIFQDGEMVDAPATDALPAELDLRGLPVETEAFIFYAALPLLANHGGNAARSGERVQRARYGLAHADTPDLFSQALGIDMAYLSAAVEFVSELDTRLSHVTFPIAKIRRADSGGFELDPAFIAASLSIGAAPALEQQLRSLMKKLKTKVDALSERLSEPTSKVIEVRSGDVTSFLLMQTICHAYGVLGHYEKNRALHPEALFCELLRLAGGLMTFSKAYGPENLPVYDHNALGAAFGVLDAMLRDLVDTVISARYFMIPLSRDKNRQSFQHGRLDSGKIDQHTQLYLAVSAEIPAIELVALIPVRLKIGSPDDVERSVATAVSGVKLLHLPQVPEAVPIRPNTYYFLLENKSVLYDNMLKAQAISIYAPSGIAGLSMELFGVTPQ